MPTPSAGESRDKILLAVMAAIVLHGAIGILLLRLPLTRLPRLPREDSLTVHILTPRQLDPAVAPRTKDLGPPAAPSAAALQPPNARMTPAKRFFSGGLLADPRSRPAREALPSLAPDERILQLCNIEAMGQVQTTKEASFEPDLVVAYAMAEPALSDHAVSADGAAFRSRKRWYGIRYRCTVSPDLSKVDSFAYRIGEPIPEDQWARHGLVAEDGPAD